MTEQSKPKVQVRGLGFLQILTLILITLKLTGHIEWSWWLVLGPLWMPVALLLLVAATLLPAAYLLDYVLGKVRQ